jgi:hypothetical protein
LKAYFEKVYTDLDFDRVYASDMKKMIKWFEIITAKNIDIPVAPADTEKPEEKPKAVKTPKIETTHVKEGKPSKSAPRKIESRGVK